MKKIYDHKENLTGYLDNTNTTVYDNHHKVIGYVADPYLLNENHMPVAYVANQIMYDVNTGMPLGYFDGWNVVDMSGNRLGRVDSSWLGLLAAGLLLGYGLGGWGWGWGGWGYPYGYGFGYPYGYGFGYPYGFGFGYPYYGGFFI